MIVSIFRRSDFRMVKEHKYFSDRAAAERFCQYVAPKIWGKDVYFYV